MPQSPIAAAAAADCTYLEARRLSRSLVIIVLPPCLQKLRHCFSFEHLHDPCCDNRLWLSGTLRVANARRSVTAPQNWTYDK